MSNKLFTSEEMEMFRASPHVVSVSSRSVTFTPAFKKKVYQEMLTGKRIKDILEAHDIDTAALGGARINGLLQRIRKESEREEGFTDVRRQRRSKTREEKQISAEKRIRQLEAELAYTRQEVEFLKKVRAADMEAQKAWASRHQPK